MLGPAAGVPPIARGVAVGAVIGVVAAEHERARHDGGTVDPARRLANAGSGEPLKSHADDCGIPSTGPHSPARRAVGNWGKPYTARTGATPTFTGWRRQRFRSSG